MVVHTNSTNPTNPITGALKPSVSCSFASLGLRSRSLACHHPFSLPLPRRLWIFITFGARRLQTLLFFCIALALSVSRLALLSSHTPDRLRQRHRPSPFPLLLYQLFTADGYPLPPSSFLDSRSMPPLQFCDAGCTLHRHSLVCASARA